MKSEEAKRLKELENENSRLKRLLAEAELDKAISKESTSGKRLGPTEKRETVERIKKSLAVSERRACTALEFPRSSVRYQRKTRQDEPQLRKRILELVRERPRFGYRRIAQLLQNEGYRVNVKRIYRIWLAEGLKVPRKTRKKRALGHGENACHLRRAEGINDVWCWILSSIGRPTVNPSNGYRLLMNTLAAASHSTCPRA